MKVHPGHPVHGAERCLYCGLPATIVWVHGHGQCTHCGINVDECCRGESCETDRDSGPDEG